MGITQIMCALVALGIQLAMRMRHVIIISGLPHSTNFSTLYHERHDFFKKKLLHIKCVFRVSVQFWQKCCSF
jgi:hypothetical protein